MKTPTMISGRTIGKGKFLELSELTLAHPNGDISTYETISRNKKKVFGIVSVLPITVDNEIILIRQYRAPLDRIVLELPAGCAEIWKHNTLEDAVHEELLEETWYKAWELYPIAEFSSSSGMTNEAVHGYVVINCTKVSDILDLDESEYIERIVVPFSDFDKLIASEIRRGNIIEPKMLAIMYAWKQEMV